MYKKLCQRTSSIASPRATGIAIMLKLDNYRKVIEKVVS
jgi:hypothetical protein